MRQKDPEFWVLNLSTKSIQIEDLGINIPARKSINLLSSKSDYTAEQLENSLSYGSLYKKSLYLKVRKTQPPPAIKPGVYKIIIDPRKIPNRSTVVMHQRKLEDLIENNESDEKFIMDFLNEEDVVNKNKR